MIGYQLDNSNSQFAHNIYTSYLWNSSPEEMFDTVMALMARAEEYGVEIDYSKFGIIKE